ncbi:MAG: PAS domain-containing protein [Candidatus Competibacterales bacterium]
MLLALLQNAGLLTLAGLAVFAVLNAAGLRGQSVHRALGLGLLFGTTALFVSLLPVYTADGAVLDARGGPLLFAGFLGGPVAALVAAALGATGRLLVAGPLVFSGVIAYFVYGALGAAYGHWRRSVPSSPITGCQVVVLSFLGILGAALMFFLIADSVRANHWLSHWLPLIALANTASTVIIGAFVHYALVMGQRARAVQVLQERLQLAVKSAGLGVWDYDPTNDQILWDEGLCRLYGLAGVNQTPLAAWCAAIHPDDRVSVERGLQRLLATGGDVELEFRIAVRDGNTRHLKTNARGVCDHRGQVVRVVGISNDIGALRRSEEAVRASERRFADMAANVPGAIWRYIQHGDGREEMEYLSPNCSDLWELPLEVLQANPQRRWAMVHPEDIAGVRTARDEAARQGVAWTRRFRLRTPSGKEKWLEVRGRPGHLADGAVCWNTLAFDISQQVATEEALAKSQALYHRAQRLEAIGRLTGGIAHDFNNLLAIIRGNLELFAQGEGGFEAEELVGEALEAAERGAALTHQLLAFGRRSQLQPAVVNVNHVIDELDRLLQRTLPETIAVERLCPGGVWPAQLDRTQLENALLNLALNARDAMPQGGKLTFETANVHLDQDYIASHNEDIEPGPFVLVTVSDTGHGMSEEVRQRVFEPFFSTKAPGQGSGLGLSTVYGFVKQSQGSMEIYSEVGLGTAVKLYFPAAVDGEVAIQPPRVASPPRGGERVLVVEDDQRVRKVLVRQLQSLGYAVTAVDNGAAAREAVAAGAVDLVMTDVVMPGAIQGPQLAQQLRVDYPQLPVIFVSGYPTEIVLQNGGLGPDDIHLMKPTSLENLAQAVRRALG